MENYHKAGLFREGQNLEVCTRQLPKCLSPNWFHRLGCDNVDESILQWKKFLTIMEQCIPKATLGLGLLKHLYSNQEMYLRDLGDVTMLKSIERIRMRNWVMTMLWNRMKLFFKTSILTITKQFWKAINNVVSTTPGESKYAQWLLLKRLQQITTFSANHRLLQLSSCWWLPRWDPYVYQVRSNWNLDLAKAHLEYPSQV